MAEDTGLFERWPTKAAENEARWGQQSEATLLLAMLEELGELAEDISTARTRHAGARNSTIWRRCVSSTVTPSIGQHNRAPTVVKPGSSPGGPLDSVQGSLVPLPLPAVHYQTHAPRTPRGC